MRHMGQIDDEGRGGKLMAGLPMAVDCLGGMERLASVIAAAHDSGEAVVSAILQFLAESLEVGLVFFSRIDGPTLLIEGAIDRAEMGLRDGDAIPLRDTYCQTLIARASSTLVVEDARVDPHFAALATTRDLGIGACSGVPLYRADGALYGTLCALHPRPRATRPGELATLTLAGRVIMQAVESDEARAREARRQSEVAAAARMSAIYRAMASGVVLLDGLGRVVDANPAAQEILGVPADEMRGQVLSDTLWEPARPDGTVLPVAERPDMAAPRGGQPQRGVTASVRRPDGTLRWLQIDAIPLPFDGGASGVGDDAGRVVVSFVDITARKEAEASLAHQATHDALTDCPTACCYATA